MFNPAQTSGTTSSPWLSTQTATYTSLTADIATEVCVIGAGMAGISVAYQLLQAGKSVVVIDDGFIGSGETGRTTAHLSTALDDRYYAIAQCHGTANAMLAAQSHTAAIDFIETVVQQEQLSCDFERVSGYLFRDPASPHDLLTQELTAAQGAGLSGVELLDAQGLHSFASGACLHFPRQAQFHPLQYLTQLAQKISARGVKIFTQTQAAHIVPGTPAQVKTSTGHTITAAHVVISTNTPIYSKTLLFAKQTSTRTYVIAAKVPKDSVLKALYWDTAQPYHYVRLSPLDHAFDLLIVGGEDHRTGELLPDPEAPFANLIAWTRTHVPNLGEVLYQWSGQVQEPTDYLAFIGRTNPKEENIYVVTGDSGNGMTHGAIAALLLTDLICGRVNPWEQLYSPMRSAFKNTKELVAHNLTAAGHYLDYFAPSKIDSVAAIQPGCGAIIRRGLNKIAVYRDAQNELHEVSAVCTHMQAQLQWNDVEKTWDCPAHGSRFATCGKVVHGPAIKPLPPK